MLLVENHGISRIVERTSTAVRQIIKNTGPNTCVRSLRARPIPASWQILRTDGQFEDEDSDRPGTLKVECPRGLSRLSVPYVVPAFPGDCHG